MSTGRVVGAFAVVFGVQAALAGPLCRFDEAHALGRAAEAAQTGASVSTATRRDATHQYWHFAASIFRSCSDWRSAAKGRPQKTDVARAVIGKLRSLRTAGVDPEASATIAYLVGLGDTPRTTLTPMTTMVPVMGAGDPSSGGGMTLTPMTYLVPTYEVARKVRLNADVRLEKASALLSRRYKDAFPRIEIGAASCMSVDG